MRPTRARSPFEFLRNVEEATPHHQVFFDFGLLWGSRSAPGFKVVVYHDNHNIELLGKSLLPMRKGNSSTDFGVTQKACVLFWRERETQKEEDIVPQCRRRSALQPKTKYATASKGEKMRKGDKAWAALKPDSYFWPPTKNQQNKLQNLFHYRGSYNLSVAEEKKKKRIVCLAALHLVTT